MQKTYHRHDDQHTEGLKGPKMGGPKARSAIQTSFMPFSEIGMWAILLFLKLLQNYLMTVFNLYSLQTKHYF